MKMSRNLWILWIITTVLYSAWTDSRMGYLLTAVSVLLPLLTGVISRWILKKIRCEMSLSAYGEKDAEISGRLTVENKGFLPADRLICQVLCENLLTGERETIPLRMAVPAKSKESTEFRMRSCHAGRIRVSVKKLICLDLFGLFRFQKKPETEGSALGLVGPHIFSLETQIAYGESANMDSDEYSMKKAGYDPSETFAIREYQPGDRIRQIHWKLTEKFDSLMVRDYGLPIQNTVLLLLETGRMPGSEKADPDCLDALAEAILSVSRELISQQIVHSIGWQNHEENEFSCVEIEHDEDLNLALPGILGAVPGEDPSSVADHYMESREQLEFAHMVVFTPAHQDSLGALAEQCLVTEVICSPQAAGYDQQNGVAIIGAAPQELPETLAYLEI